MSTHDTVAPIVLHLVEAAEGGLRRHVVDLVNGLHDLGWHQIVAYSPMRADGAMRAAVTSWHAIGIEVVEIPMVRRIDLVQDWYAVRALIALVRARKVRVLHLHSSKAGGVGRLAAMFVPNVKVVYTPHAAAVHLSWKYHAIEAFLGWFRTSALIAVSESERMELRSARIISRDRLHCVPNGIDTHSLGVVPRAGRSDRPPVVLTCGRITAQKDPLFVAEVSALVSAAIPLARFVWVGDGEMRDAFVRTVERLGVAARWTITGWLDDPFVEMAACDIFVLGSKYESFGYVTLEAMALGRPVVVTAVAGSVDLVEDGWSGRLIACGDVQGFAEAIIVLLRDVSRAEAIGRAAIAQSARFTRTAMVEGVDRLYHRLLL